MAKWVSKQLVRRLEAAVCCRIANIVLQISFSSTWSPYIVAARSVLLWDPPLQFTLNQREFLFASGEQPVAPSLSVRSQLLQLPAHYKKALLQAEAGLSGTQQLLKQSGGGGTSSAVAACVDTGAAASKPLSLRNKEQPPPTAAATVAVGKNDDDDDDMPISPTPYAFPSSLMSRPPIKVGYGDEDLAFRSVRDRETRGTYARSSASREKRPMSASAVIGHLPGSGEFGGHAAAMPMTATATGEDVGVSLQQMRASNEKERADKREAERGSGGITSQLIGNGKQFTGIYGANRGLRGRVASPHSLQVPLPPSLRKITPFTLFI